MAVIAAGGGGGGAAAAAAVIGVRMTTQLFSQVPVLMASFTTTTDTLTCVLLVQSSMGSRKISLSVWFDHQHAKLAVPCNQKIDCNADLGSLVRSRQYGWHKSQLLLILADTESPGSLQIQTETRLRLAKPAEVVQEHWPTARLSQWSDVRSD